MADHSDTSPLTTARRKLALHWGRRVLSRFVRDDAPHPTPVTLMVPLAPKDIDRAAVSIPLLRDRCAHPVAETVIVAPQSDAIAALADRLGARLVVEDGPLSALLGADRLTGLSGWLRQQFLKLAAPEVTGADLTVACDSDTYPLRPTAWLTPDGRPILYEGDRNAAPFHRFTEALIGPTPQPETSFVAHTMLFRRADLTALRAAIETRHGQPWHEAVLATLARPTAEVGTLSEFDLLGHFLLREHPSTIATRYYANIKVTGAEFRGDTPLPGWKRRFRFVSNHQRGG